MPGSVTPSGSLKTVETIIISPSVARPDPVSPTLSLMSKADSSSKEVNSLQPSVSSKVTSIMTETVYGSVNLVTRLRDTVLVFTTSPSSVSSTIAPSPGDIS